MKAEIAMLGFLLVIAGVFLMILGMLLGPAKGEGEIRGGGVVLIGPVPIVFGTDAKSLKYLIAMVIILILLVYFLFYRR